MLLVRLIYNFSARGAASRRWKFPIFWERAKRTTLNRRRRINVDARSNRKSSTCSRNSSQIARAIPTDVIKKSARQRGYSVFDASYEICQNCRNPGDIRAKSRIIDNPRSWRHSTNRRQDDEIQGSRRAGIADSWMRRNCRLLTFRRTILSLIIYDPDVIAMKSFGYWLFDRC